MELERKKWNGEDRRRENVMRRGKESPGRKV